MAAYLLLTFAPFIYLLGFLSLNQKAINVLRDAGIRVGLMGARKEDLLHAATSMKDCNHSNE